MRKATPSLNAIRAFEAAARHESFAKAAEELSVSASAVSQQVAQLESDLEIQLFTRVKQRLQLTKAGKVYLASLSPALDRIESATIDLVSSKGLKQLTIGSLPSLASYWLIPRLSHFIEEHPGIKLHVVTLDLDFAAPQRSPNLQGGRIDVGLFYGDGHWNGLDAEKFMTERLGAVTSPERVGLLSGNGLDEDRWLDQLPLMQHSTRPSSWEAWFRSKGMPPRVPQGPSFEHFHMLVDAAKAGIGAALVPLAFVEKELDSGRLVRLGRHELKSERAYYWVTQHDASLSEARQKFCQWLQHQAEGNL